MHLLSGALCALTAATLVTTNVAAPAHAAVSRIAAPDPSVNPATHPNEYENRVMDKVNDRRAHRGLPRLRYYQSCLDKKSEGWAKYLAEVGQLRHRSQRQVLADCNLHWTGETVATGSRIGLSPSELVSAWMHSRPHRLVLMKPRASRAGVGIHFDSRGNLWAVVNLGDPT